MSRFIDAEWLKGEIRKAFPSFYMRVEINTLVNLAPSIDIVRCVECRYKGMEICPMYKLTKAGVLKPYDFCSYGESDSEKPNNSKERSSE